MPKKSAPKRKTPPHHEPRIEVRRSRVHGKGVYATAPIRKGVRIIEYTGRHIPWKEALELPPRRPDDPNHTFFFELDNGDVIDAGQGGNEARWINHSCDPNCETIEEDDDRIFVYALRSLRPGDELFYDYQIVASERRTKRLEREFACHCGTERCRGTMLEPPPRRRRLRKAASKVQKLTV